MVSQRFMVRWASLALLALIGMSVGGCPITQNQPPVANAGPDQTVAAGAAATLNGTGSNDPDGDTLTFAWTQTAGTVVVLSNPNSASPTFTAPATAQTLTFQLTVNDGAGNTASDSMNVVVQTGPPPAPPRLFIASFTGNNVISYANPKTVNGNIPPDTNLAGALTQLAAPSDVIVDKGGALLVSNFTTKAITAYNGAATTNGNFPPNRNVVGAATGLNGPTALAVNTTNDLVFVSNIGAATKTITVYAGASTATFNGNLGPTRTIQSPDLTNPFGINFGASDNLYAANNGVNNVVVFANASNLNGTVPATRILTSAAFAALFDVFVDKSDRLYVVNSVAGGNKINIFNNASTLNGTVSPNFTLTVQGAVNLSAIRVDSGGTGYIVDNGNNAVYSYDNIATRNGTFPPDRTIKGSNTQLVGPLRCFLLEP